MLYDGLISVDLPSRLGPPLPATPSQRLERLLFEGSWHRRRAECTASAAAVLAGCYQALKSLSPTSVTLLDDADEVLSLTVMGEDWGDAPAPWAEQLPAAWLTEPCAFTLRARLAPEGAAWDGSAIRAVLSLRYSPRHDPEVGALVGSLRAVWTVEEREDVEHTQRDLDATLADFGAAKAIQLALGAWGERVAEQAEEALEASLEEARVSRFGRVVALWGIGEEPERFDRRLAGFEAEDRLALAALAQRAAEGREDWPAIGPDGVEGRIRRGRFVSVVDNEGARDAS